MQKPKHILIFRFSAMGDVALVAPVLLALLDRHKDLKITVVTRPFFKPIFDRIPNTTVFTADFKGKHKGIFGLFKFSRELTRIDFDVIADLHNVLRTKILKLFLFGRKAVTLDKGRKEKKALTKGKLFRQLRPTSMRYAEVFQKMGFKMDLSKGLTLPRQQLDANTKVFLKNGGKLHVGIAPFAAHKGKMYPLDKMKKVIAQLAKKYNIILFGGGQDEVELLNEIEKGHENVKSVAGKLEFDEELALISNLDVMLSMDSGNAHLAAMFGIKVVTIWGVTHPFAGFSPFNQPDSYALTADRSKFPLVPTSIYGNKYPKGYENAAGSVSPEQITKLIEQIC